jgi:hypothetical protein
MNVSTCRVIWKHLQVDDVEQFKKYVSDETSYRFAQANMWSKKSEGGIRSRSLVETCCINVKGVPETGAHRILEYLLTQFPHMIQVSEVIKCIKLSQYKERPKIVSCLLNFMNTFHTSIHGLPLENMRWVLKEDHKDVEKTCGYFVCLKTGMSWLSTDAYIHKAQTCPHSGNKVPPRHHAPSCRR